MSEMITFRTFIVVCLLFALSVSGCANDMARPDVNPSTIKRPNILLIVAEEAARKR
ncbi:MAG: hypothetical protein WBN45_15685 [Arenicellales bacterium]